MTEQVGTIAIGEKDGRIFTQFIPPIPEDLLFDAMSGALPVRKIVRDQKDGGTIASIIFDAGKPNLLEDKLLLLRKDIEAATGYTAIEGVKKLGKTATKQ